MVVFLIIESDFKDVIGVYKTQLLAQTEVDSLDKSNISYSIECWEVVE